MLALFNGVLNSRKGEKSILMDAKYSEMLGLTYEELLKNSAFLSAIGGNVPRDVDPAFDTKVQFLNWFKR